MRYKLVFLVLLLSLAANAELRLRISSTGEPRSAAVVENSLALTIGPVAAPLAVGPKPEVVTFAQFARSWRLYGAAAGMFFFNDACPATAPSGVTTCFWISTAGVDTNAGTTKLAPWQHAPGMVTGPVHTPVPGEGFILRGDETWGASNLAWDWQWSGSGSGGVATTPIYIGVDKTWFAGASWARPIISCSGGNCAQKAGGITFTAMRLYNVNYVVVDNLEITPPWIMGNDSNYANGLGAHAGIVYLGAVELKNLYIHGWGHAAWDFGSKTVATLPASPTLWQLAHVVDYDGSGGDCTGHGGGAFDAICQWTGTTWQIGGPNTWGVTGSISNGTDALIGSSVHDSVFDGGDTQLDDGICVTTAQAIYNNVCRNVFNGFNGASDDLHSNLVELVNFHASSGLHCNEVYDKGYIDSTAKKKVIYGNVIRHNTASGCVIFYVNDLVNCPTCVTEVALNLVFDTAGGNPVFSIGGSSVGTSAGTVNARNNTVEAGANACFGNGLSGTNAQTLNYDNNHCITSALSVVSCGTIITCNDGGHNLLQNAATASTNYDDANGTVTGYAYAPKNASAEGHATPGANLTSLVSSIGSWFGFDTLYGCSLGAGNVTVCPGRTAVARPNAAWDVGAYEFSAGGSAGSGTLSSSLAVVLHGQTYTLTWTTANCSSASIDQGIGAVSCAGGTTSPITMAGTKTYTLTVVGAGGNGTASVTVTQGGSVASANTVRTANTVVQ